MTYASFMKNVNDSDLKWVSIIAGIIIQKKNDNRSMRFFPPQKITDSGYCIIPCFSI